MMYYFSLFFSSSALKFFPFKHQFYLHFYFQVQDRFIHKLSIFLRICTILKESSKDKIPLIFIKRIYLYLKHFYKHP